MSHRWHLICRSHRPELRMEDGINHGEYRLADMWRARAQLIAEYDDPNFMYWKDSEEGVASAKRFLVQHPDCRLVVADEYGHERISPDRLVAS